MEKQGKRVVITGGPGTGKTSLVRHLEDDGHMCYPEIIRTMTEAAKLASETEEFTTNPLAFVQDPMEFNRRLLEGRKAQYLESFSDPQPLIFFDRGIPDVLAYMDYFKQAYTADYEAACKEMRYDTVILLPPWRAIYRSDGERFESFQEAEEIHEHLLNTYKRFGYDPILVPTGPVPDRVTYLIEQL